MTSHALSSVTKGSLFLSLIGCACLDQVLLGLLFMGPFLTITTNFAR